MKTVERSCESNVRYVSRKSLGKGKCDAKIKEKEEKYWKESRQGFRVVEWRLLTYDRSTGVRTAESAVSVSWRRADFMVV